MSIQSDDHPDPSLSFDFLKLVAIIDMFPKAIVGRGRSAVWPEEKRKKNTNQPCGIYMRFESKQRKKTHQKFHFTSLQLYSMQAKLEITGREHSGNPHFKGKKFYFKMNR